jgi:hypothetical protein
VKFALRRLAASAPTDKNGSCQDETKKCSIEVVIVVGKGPDRLRGRLCDVSVILACRLSLLRVRARKRLDDLLVDLHGAYPPASSEGSRLPCVAEAPWDGPRCQSTRQGNEASHNSRRRPYIPSRNEDLDAAVSSRNRVQFGGQPPGESLGYTPLVDVEKNKGETGM